MFPEFTIFSYQIPSYGVAVLVGAVFAVIYEKLREKAFPELMRDTELIFIWAGLGAAAGAKLLYLLIELPDIIYYLRVMNDPVTVVKAYLLGGFVFYGGFFGCIAAVWFYCRWAKISFDRTMQLFLPLFPLVHAFGRVGCFLVGCCYGAEAGDFPLAVVFTHSPAAPNGVPLYPVQLVEAVAEIALFVLLAVLSVKGVSGVRMLGLYSVLYGGLRFVLEFFRGDAHRGLLWGFSTSQYIAVFTVILVAVTALWRRKRITKTPYNKNS